MPDHRHGLGGENSPCLLTDYDDDVAVCRETFHEFMARQAEEHWAKEISSLDIESPANRIAAVIEKEVSTLTKKVDAIATAMAVETSGDLASRLFAMIPSRENLIATLDDRIFSKLQLVERSAQQGLAIDDASSLASGTPNITSMAEWQVGDGSNTTWTSPRKRTESPMKSAPSSPSKRRRVTYSEHKSGSVTGVPCTSSQQVDCLDFYPPDQSGAAVAKSVSTPNTMSSWKSSSSNRRPIDDTVDLHLVRGNQWVFHFQSTGTWYTIKCHWSDCLEQGPGMLTRLRKHLTSKRTCRCLDLKWPYTDQLMVERFGYRVIGGVFDCGSKADISKWVNDSNDIIRHRETKKTNK